METEYTYGEGIAYYVTTRIGANRIQKEEKLREDRQYVYAWSRLDIAKLWADIVKDPTMTIVRISGHLRYITGTPLAQIDTAKPYAIDALIKFKLGKK